MISLRLRLVILLASMNCGADTPGGVPMTEYQIDVELLDMSGTIHGKEEVLFLNETGATLDTLYGYLILENAKLEVKGLSVGFMEPEGVWQQISESSLIFNIVLDSPLQSGETRTLEISFSGKIPEDKKYHEGAVAARFLWYPALSSPVEWWHLQNIMNPAVFEVHLAVPRSHNVAISAQNRTDSEGSDGRKHVHAYAERDIESVWISSDLYRSTLSKSPSGDIRVYYSELEKLQAPFVAEVAAEVSRYYAELLGSFPFPDVCLVPGSRDVTGGGNAGPRVLMLHKMHELPTPEAGEDVTPTRRIVAHELGHLYWSDWVLLDHDFPLGLGLGMWIDQQYTESIGEAATIEKNLFVLYVGAARSGHNTRMDQSSEELQEAPFNVLEIMWHGKGYAFVSMLEYLMGRQNFISLLRQLVADYGCADRKVTEGVFRALAETVLEADLAWFFDQWLHTNKVLDYGIGEVVRDKGQLGVEILQLRDAVMPVVVQLETVQGECLRKRTTGGAESETVYFGDVTWARLVLDPDERIPDIDRSNNEVKSGAR